MSICIYCIVMHAGSSYFNPIVIKIRWNYIEIIFLERAKIFSAASFTTCLLRINATFIHLRFTHITIMRTNDTLKHTRLDQTTIMRWMKQYGMHVSNHIIINNKANDTLWHTRSDHINYIMRKMTYV